MLFNQKHFLPSKPTFYLEIRIWLPTHYPLPITHYLLPNPLHFLLNRVATTLCSRAIAIS